MRVLFHIACAGIALSACQPQAKLDLPRDAIASTSLCGDSYALALMPETIKSLPQISDAPEDILRWRNAHIIYGPGEGERTSRFAKLSTTLAWGEDFGAVWANMEQLKTGSSKAWKSRLTSIQKPERTPKILYLSRAGGTAGPGTFVDAVIAAAGGENVITTAGWFTPDPEVLLAQKPDIILTSFYDSNYTSVNDAGYRHKAVSEYLSRLANFGHARGQASLKRQRYWRKP